MDFFIDADMAELADAPDLGSGGQPCRFKSCYPHKIRVLRHFKCFKTLIFLRLTAILTAVYGKNGQNESIYVIII